MLASAHPKATTGVTRKILMATTKIGLKIPHTRAYNFEGSGRNLTKLYLGM